VSIAILKLNFKIGSRALVLLLIPSLLFDHILTPCAVRQLCLTFFSFSFVIKTLNGAANGHSNHLLSIPAQVPHSHRQAVVSNLFFLFLLLFFRFQRKSPTPIVRQLCLTFFFFFFCY
jgi:hypothetical protein